MSALTMLRDVEAQRIAAYRAPSTSAPRMPHQLLRLQGLAGNAATAAMVRRTADRARGRLTVQRSCCSSCASGGPCDKEEVPVQRAPRRDAVQRWPWDDEDEADTAEQPAAPEQAPASSASSNPGSAWSGGAPADAGGGWSSGEPAPDSGEGDWDDARIAATAAQVYAQHGAMLRASFSLTPPDPNNPFGRVPATDQECGDLSETATARCNQDIKDRVVGIGVVAGLLALTGIGAPAGAIAGIAALLIDYMGAEYCEANRQVFKQYCRKLFPSVPAPTPGPGPTPGGPPPHQLEPDPADPGIGRCDEPVRPGQTICVTPDGGFCSQLPDGTITECSDPPRTPAPSGPATGCRSECNQGPVPQPLVRRGSVGPSVGELQEKLNTVIVVGEPLVVDCDFGPRTDDVVRQFQANENLTADGIAGPKTWERLDTVAVRPLCPA